MKFYLHCRFTDGKKNFRVIGLEFHPQPENKLKIFYEFEEEGVQPTTVRMREADYMNDLLIKGKLRYL